jgi:DNA-directed RNA polymerase subunit M/transcription elongation factor TFIIS
MDFCPRCDNMLFINVSDSESKNLVMYCKNCQFSEEKDQKTTLIIDDNKVSDVINYSMFLNKNIKYDSTLPHVDNIACTYSDCKKSKNDVIYLKYDFVNMKYIYYCCECDRFFKSSK